MSKIALITGATAGIGKFTAIKFAQNGYKLIITGRRQELLSELANFLKQEFKTEVLTLCFDVRDNEQVTKAINNIDAEWKKIDVLVNNAGLALGLGEIHEGNIDDWDTMIDTNVKGVLYTTRAVAPLLIKQAKGHIINISSIAAKGVYKNGNVYCATKHALDALTAAMRIDMLEHGIKVTSINPGPAETEFSIVRFKGDKEKAKDVYNGYKPLSGEDVAECIFFAASQPEHVNINEIIVMPKAMANMVYSHKV
ncbi:MAG: NAD(P)-dependent oxidoreductase [Bacteroidetes bacterium GWE2_29_8]|nr:MAG: NAD(P)-dependent oxidoreductase [Bacteroidetes bacterium GWE2_29_8]OFY20071.1 MAG: NAD(P)-dependent oxidoreductase [Bacteroidetes bacterium GWF2_29_10]